MVVVGLGAAGASAALEASREGAETLVLERAAGGGGTSAMSGGLLYLGARAIGLTQSVGLVIAIVGGPTLVSAIVLGGMIVRAQRTQGSQDSQSEDATATRNDA